LPLEKMPSHMTFSMDNRTVYVSLQESGEIAAIDLPTQTVDWRMHVEDALRTVFDTGRLLEEVTLAEVRARAHAHEVASEARQPEAEEVPVPLA
ncbi:hypothetical protein PPH41_43150, partial [Burkholderia gladioli]|nr:hypothetical protein [Burkholderia gladioli]